MRRKISHRYSAQAHDVSRGSLTRAVDISTTYDKLSFGDATIAAFMERTELEYLYSFDDDFDVLDHVTRLETAVNPFS